LSVAFAKSSEFVHLRSTPSGTVSKKLAALTCGCEINVDPKN